MNAEFRAMRLEYENSDYDYLVYIAKESYAIEDSNSYNKKDLIDMMMSIEEDILYK